MLPVVQSLAGLVAIPLLALALSENRRALPAAALAQLISVGIALQFLVAGALLLVPQLTVVFDALAGAVAALQIATGAGMQFVFGYVAGGPAPFAIADPARRFILAFQALPVILIMSVLARLLYHWGILQKVVALFAMLLSRSMGVSGPLATVSAANIFLGMIEAPLLVRPYLAAMSRGSLFATMTVGMATVAGTVMALYASFLESSIPGAAGHVLIASIMSAPAALLVARLMVPWSREADGPAAPALARDDCASAMDAIARGTADGVRLLVGVTAMLIVAVALVTLVNMMLGAVTEPLGSRLTIEQVLGWVMAPVAFLIGIPWSEAATAGQLIGIKTVLNELIAYLSLAETPATTLSPRSRLILLYALCGFANFGSLGIMTGGLVAMCPERRAEILELAPRTIVSGTLATLMTGAVIGVLRLPG
jgi:CNT family concentrative nucleoside transporter